MYFKKRFEAKKREAAPKEVDTVLKKNAPGLIKLLNDEFKRAGSDARLELANPDQARFSDGWYLRVKSAGTWDDPARMLNLRLAGKEYRGVIYKDGEIYLKAGSRPMSHRGQVPGESAVKERSKVVWPNFPDEFKNLDAVMDDGKPAKTETAPDDYARNNFLEDALDYAEIKDDNGNVTLLKFYKNKYSDDFKLDSYDGENQKTLAVGGLRYVVGRYGEFLDMGPAEAIIEIAKE